MNMEHPTILYRFDDYAVRAHWRVVDDIVMGGHSEGHFAITEEKHGRFFGHVSLRDDGGFSSVRYRFDTPFALGTGRTVRLHLRGDGSDYQFRIKPEQALDYVYAMPFATSGAWETITVDLDRMYPVRRGKRLDMPDFSGSQIAELGFLIANGKEQSFQLLIDRLEVL